MPQYVVISKLINFTTLLTIKGQTKTYKLKSQTQIIKAKLSFIISVINYNTGAPNPIPLYRAVLL